jgi:hypothetical protein
LPIGGKSEEVADLKKYHKRFKNQVIRGCGIIEK